MLFARILKNILSHTSAYQQINRTKINVPNINVLQINGSLHQQKLVEQNAI
jgi:hypothetical protein